MSCSHIKQLGLHAIPGQHIETAFVKGHVKGKNAKTLLKKIDKHRDFAAHEICEKILAEREGEHIQTAMKNAELKFVERNKENVEATAKVFRTAYECAKSHLPHTEHTRLIELQSINGVNCGNILYSNNACSDIISHVSTQMCDELIKHIVSCQSKFAILVDESTSVANIQSMVVYLRTIFGGEICTYFLGLLELTDATAVGLEKVLVDYLHTIGLEDDVLRVNFVGFCSDGASCMIGQHKGVATLLKAKFPLLQTFHCMAHRLELAVKNSVDDINVVSHFKIFVDALYKVYSMSPKNQRELNAVAESLSVELLKIQKVFDVRWVFSSFVAVKAVLRDYPALIVHFNNCAGLDTVGRTSKDRSKYKGLVVKLKSWFFLSEACLLKDALRCLKQLSLYLQSHEANILNAASHVDDTINKLQALKLIKLPESGEHDVVNSDDEDESDADEPDDDHSNNDGALPLDAKIDNDGDAEVEESRVDADSEKKAKGNVTTLSKFWDNFANDGLYKGVTVKKNKSDAENFEKLRGQFLQSLCDNLKQRFPSSDLLEASVCLNKSSWPTDALERALFGEKHVANLCKLFGIGSKEAADTVLEYAMYKKSDGASMGLNLHYLISVLKVLPVSSADCERGFSQMNLFHTSGRNRLIVKSVNDLLMIGINGPPLKAWNAVKYVVTWLKSGRHGALDKPTGLPKKVDTVPHSSTLFT